MTTVAVKTIINGRTVYLGFQSSVEAQMKRKAIERKILKGGIPIPDREERK